MTENNIYSYGSYGIVYDIGNKVIKYIKNKPNVLNTFYREISLIKYLKDIDGVIKIDKVIITKQLNGFIMKKYANTLYDKYSQLNKDSIKNVIYQIIKTLHQIHSLNVIHRDIKPNNILLDDNNNIVICDFGLSILCLSKTSMLNNNDNVQNVLYRAPEIMFNINHHTEKIDIWSVGIVMLELYTQRNIIKDSTNYLEEILDYITTFNIFDSKIYDESIKKIEKDYNIDIMDYINNNKKCNNNIDDIISKINDNDLCDLLRNMLQINPSNRYSTEQILKHKYFSNIFDINDIKKPKQQYNKTIYSYFHNKNRLSFINKIIYYQDKYNLDENIFYSITYYDIINNKLNNNDISIGDICINIAMKTFYNYPINSDNMKEKKYLEILNYELIYKTALTELLKMNNDINYYHMCIYLYLILNRDNKIVFYSNNEIVETTYYLIEILSDEYNLMFQLQNSLYKKKVNYNLINTRLLKIIVNEHNKRKKDNIGMYCYNNLPYFYYHKLRNFFDDNFD